VVRDISVNLRAVTQAMQRLAAGERDARVPAMERRDEIGDLARVFNVFKDQAFQVETLHRQLVEKSNLLVATFDSMNDGFTVFDADERLIAWNPRYLQLYGLTDDDVGLGTPLGHIHQVLADKGAQALSFGEAVALPGLSASVLP
jgi:PAS domain-containing protein